MGASPVNLAQIEHTIPQVTIPVNTRLTVSGPETNRKKVDAATLRRLRQQDRLSVKAIARRYDVAPQTVKGWLIDARIVVQPKAPKYPAIDALRALLCGGAV